MIFVMQLPDSGLTWSLSCLMGLTDVYVPTVIYPGGFVCVFVECIECIIKIRCLGKLIYVSI